MKEKKSNLYIYTFYRFFNVLNKDSIKKSLDFQLKRINIKGTILISDEGINGSLSSTKQNLDVAIKLIKSLLRIRKLEVKINRNSFIPFNRFKVKIKKEIVSLGQGKIDVNRLRGKLIKPSEWDQVISENNIRIIDVRNDFEIDIGNFKGAERPMTKSFREFPEKFKELKVKKTDKIAMYCTGGIRCEKASSFLKKEGYRNVVQLKGGIIGYLDHLNKNSRTKLWSGECFVFDNRVTIKKNLSKGSYDQCYGCKHPIKDYEKKLESYVKGVSCKYCYNQRTDGQKKRSKIRQLQIDNDKLEGTKNNFSKLTYSDLI